MAMRRIFLGVVTASVVLVILPASPIWAFPLVGALEDFEAGSANWKDQTGFVDSTWVMAGGAPDTSNGYLTAGFNFVNSTGNPGEDPLLYRAHDGFDSSGDAFVGDYVAENVNQLNVWVRHNIPDTVTGGMNYFARIATANNFPGAVVLNFAPVPANTWFPLSFDLTETNPLLILEGGPGSFDSVFTSVGNIQIGPIVGNDLPGFDMDFTFDLDRVSLAPEPGSAVLLACGLVGMAVTRRRRRKQ